MKIVLKLTVVCTALAGSVAHATTLVDLINAPSQAGTPFTFALTATSASTVIALAGYEVTNDEKASSITLSNGPGGSLLGPVWTYAPAPAGADAAQNGDGSALLFAGDVEGSYDTFSQSVSTTIGADYLLNFNFSNYASTQNAFRVTTNADTATPLPEPASWGMLVGGLGAIGGAMRRRKVAAFS